MTSNVDILERAKAYLAALEQGVTGAALAAFFTPDVVQEEFPNRLVPTGARRDLAMLLEGALRGQGLMRAQQYQILDALVAGNRVVLEVQWSGTLAVALGTFAAGDQMRARFAVFLTFRDGKIAEQRNYDCYEPW